MEEHPTPPKDETLTEQLLQHLSRSIASFQHEALGQMQAEFWSSYVGEPGASVETMERVFAHQAQLVTEICEQMQDTIEQACTPLAQMVVENVPGWALGLQREEARTAEQLIQEEQGEAVQANKAASARQIVTEHGWQERWRERHEMWQSPRRSVSQGIRQEGNDGPRY